MIDADTDRRFMAATLALGRRGLGLTAPNPSVAALLVKDGIVLGRGVTAPGGRPHAEPVALAQAGEAARGATIYVTLEPCSHYGRTPPCVDAILASGVARVVVAATDPDPRVAGRGIERLRAAGLDVVSGVLAEEARRDHQGHNLRVTLGRPRVTLKMAETADGFAASRVGEPRLLITGERANAEVQMLRAINDAIMIGQGTASEDDPRLSVRLPGLETRKPVRVVVSRRAMLDPRSVLVTTSFEQPVWLLVGTGVDASALVGTGVEVVTVDEESGALSLTAALRELGRRGITRVLCEGGPRLANALLRADLVDEAVTFTSERALGHEGRVSLSAEARALLLEPARFALTGDRLLGQDRRRVFERRW